MAVPTARVANRFGKALPMTGGAVGFLLTGIVVLMVSNDTLDKWECIVPYIVVYGMGRGVYVSVTDLYIDLY